MSIGSKNKILYTMFGKTSNEFTGVLSRVEPLIILQLLSHIAYLSCVWGLGVAVIMSAYVFFIPGRPYNALEAALYNSLHRIGFALAAAGHFIFTTWGQIGEKGLA
jgi:hypothetical protein